LSGGEKQRVAIARAFLKDPVIVLLYEATSALDKETENEIQKNIFELQKGRTCISVAHRLSTIADSNVIFVMDSGRLMITSTRSMNSNTMYGNSLDIRSMALAYKNASSIIPRVNHSLNLIVSDRRT
jgi:ATP-binding cassette subfamily B protein